MIALLHIAVISAGLTVSDSSLPQADSIFNDSSYENILHWYDTLDGVDDHGEARHFEEERYNRQIWLPRYIVDPTEWISPFVRERTLA